MPPKQSKDPRRKPSKGFRRELAKRAQDADEAELRTWIRDVRPAVRAAAVTELDRRGLRPIPDRLGI